MIRIREAISPAELETARGLERKLFPADDPYTEYSAKWWIAWDGQDAVGFAALTPLAREPGIWFLARSGVVRSARGNNLQCRMIRVRENYVRRAGGTQILSYTHGENMASANNLLKCGYRLYYPANLWGCKQAIYFSKDIK